MDNKIIRAGKQFAVGAFAYAVGITFVVGTAVTIAGGEMVLESIANARARNKVRRQYEERYKEAEKYDDNN